MEVASPLTGRRGVSLPFSDFCPVLTDADGESRQLFQAAVEFGRSQKWQYLELRPASAADALAFEPDGERGSRAEQDDSSTGFYTHVIDLRGDEGAILAQMDDPMRRGIRKADKAGLKIEFSDSLEAIHTYYRLHAFTRKRHGLPPQPFRFFENIARFVLATREGFVAIAKLGSEPVAAMVCFHHGEAAIYKFGASNMNFQNLRPNNLLFYEVLKHYSRAGFARLNLGRTSLANEGLRKFKLSLGAREERLGYKRFDFRSNSFVPVIDRAETWANHLFRLLPLPLLQMAGRLLYPHLS